MGLGPPDGGQNTAHFTPDNIWSGTFDRTMEKFSATRRQSQKKRAISEKKVVFSTQAPGRGFLGIKSRRIARFTSALDMFGPGQEYIFTKNIGAIAATAAILAGNSNFFPRVQQVF